MPCSMKSSFHHKNKTYHAEDLMNWLQLVLQGEHFLIKCNPCFHRYINILISFHQLSRSPKMWLAVLFWQLHLVSH